MIKGLGRILLGMIFISGGTDTFIHPDGRAKAVEKAGIPNAKQATILNGLVMAVGGTALAVGLLPKVAALALIGTLIPTTVVGHAFWKETEPGPRANQQIQFLKNSAMLGGLLFVLGEKSE